VVLVVEGSVRNTSIMVATKADSVDLLVETRLQAMSGHWCLTVSRRAEICRVANELDEQDVYMCNTIAPILCTYCVTDVTLYDARDDIDISWSAYFARQ
jgi:hypothetical protein